MMVLNVCNCILCGKNTLDTIGNAYWKEVKKNTEVFGIWRDECARTMCDILFGSETHSLFVSFKNGQFCSSCQQIVRDVNFTDRQLRSFQRTLDKLKSRVRKRINGNYSRVQEKCVETETENNVLDVDDIISDGSYLDTRVNGDYAHKELTERIFLAASDFLNEVSSSGKTTCDDVEDECGTVDNNTIKLESIKTEIEDWDPWNTEDSNSCEKGQKLNEEIGTEERKIILDEKVDDRDRCLNRKQLFQKTKRRKKSKKKLFKKEKEYTTDKNGKIVLKRGRPRKHFFDPDSKKTVSCTHENCALMFTTEEKMKVHVRGFHDGIEKPYECEHSHCSASFGKWKELVAHVKEVHDVGKKKAHFCKFCGKGYKCEEELNDHNSEAHLGSNPFTCAFCPEIHSNSVNLRAHVKKAHPDPEDMMKPYCKICDKYFSNQNNYNMHRKYQHTNPELIPTCHDCNLQFSTKGALQKHRKIKHETELKYTCETCGRAYSYIGALTAHMKIHDESNKIHACKICGKRFTTGPICKRHEVTHTGIKDYMCQICGKAFNNKGNLTAHVKLHSRKSENVTPNA